MQKIQIKVIISLLLCVGIISNINAQVKTKIFGAGIPPQLIPINKLSISEKIISAPLEFTQSLNQTKSKTENQIEYVNRFAIPVDVDLDVLPCSSTFFNFSSNSKCNFSKKDIENSYNRG